ncbi:1673_t:CDS:1 [Ambispora leptoticha]|uniref:1673_t:CDS:1 n=1 Tax=Ambispora leptoticha TaxID=144679 RepID=A0A9N8V4H1_9GLOM|nr:1673_t:CDS:1 [Ambispora leptoticha]
MKETNKPFRINKKSKTVFDFNLSNSKYKQAITRILNEEISQLDHPLKFTRSELENLLDFGRRVSSKKIPRPQNKWVLYRKAEGIKLTKNGDKPEFNAIARIIGERWQEEAQEVKRFFELLADIGKRAHQEAFPQYKYKPKRRTDSGERNYEWVKEDHEVNNKLTVSCSESDINNKLTVSCSENDTQSVQLLDEIPYISTDFNNYNYLVDPQQQIYYNDIYYSTDNTYANFTNMLQEEPEKQFINPYFLTTTDTHSATHIETQVSQFPSILSLEENLSCLNPEENLAWPFKNTSCLSFPFTS